jgi:hypothetical protein
MNNEPVAWMDDFGNVFEMKNKFFYIPLYTHPSEHDLGIAEAIGFDKGYKAATAKTLTDAEIALKSLYEAVIRYENLSPFPDNYAVESCKYQLYDAKEKARAILKKASEK